MTDGVGDAHEQGGLLGVAGRLDQARAQELISSLRAIWSATVGAEPGALAVDLELCRRWFDPVAQGHRLRRELADLPGVPAHIVDPGPPWTMAVGDGKTLVTPEGRCTLAFLEQLPTDRPTHVIGDRDTISYERRLGVLYRTWCRHRLQSVVDLLAGNTKPLQIPAAGVVMALLVNRCTTEGRALIRFAGGPRKEAVDRAFFAPVQAFSDVLAPSNRRSRSASSLVSGWMLYEARRRVGDGLVVVDARGGRDGKVWVDPDAVDQVLDRVARDLARGHRARVTPEKFSDAFDALVAGLRAELPNLAGFGLVHEQPLNTAKLKDRAVTALARYYGEP